MTDRYRAPFGENGSRPIDEAIAERLLSVALSGGGDYADLFFEYDAFGSFSYDEGILKAASRSIGMGLGVRVRAGDATGYAYVEDLSIEAMERAAKTAGQIARGGGAAPMGLATKRPSNRHQIQTPTLSVSGIDKLALLERADKAARNADPRVFQVHCSLAESVREVLIANSKGVFVRDFRPMMRFSISALVKDGEERESGSSGGGGRIGIEYFDQPNKNPEWHGREAVRQAVTMLDAREAPAGEMEVVLAPGDSGVLLHEAVGHGLEADFNRKGTSNYTDQIGQRVASELCTVIDDAQLPNSRGTVNVDDEGNIPTSSMLIENGVLRGYLQDEHSAGFFGTAPTGNGRRQSFKSHPLPRMTNTMLMSGEDDPEDIIKSVQNGVYAVKFGGGQVDITNGDFVFNLTEGYLIEDGKITAPVKGAQLIGNGPEVMRKVVALGNDMKISDGIWTCGKDGQSVPVGVGCPTVKISSVTVGGTRRGG